LFHFLNKSDFAARSRGVWKTKGRKSWRRWDKLSSELKATVVAFDHPVHREGRMAAADRSKHQVCGNRRAADDESVPNPSALLRSWEEMTEQRLKGEGETVGLSGWLKMSAEERAKLWVELRDGFRLLSAELEKHEHQGLVQ
jgi:hypothetical protein